MIALLVVLAAGPWQDAAPIPAQDPASRRNPILDGIAVQSGESLVTLSELERVFKRVREQKPPESNEQEERQRVQVLLELVTLRLEEEAGADLGVDPAQIDRISRADLEAQREKEGLLAYLSDLRAQGKDAFTEQQDRQRDIRRYLWEQSALGKPFAAERATRDQSIRPGELRALYAEHRDKLAPVTVQLRLLFVSSRAQGSPEAARASCEEARQRVLAGEDLALLVEERGDDLRDTGGLTPFRPPQVFLGALGAFAEKAQVTDLSEVMPITNLKTGQPDPNLGYMLAELHERNAPPVPEFSNPEVQRRLREVFTQQRNDFVLDRARDRLRRASYTWVSPLLSKPRPPVTGGT